MTKNYTNREAAKDLELIASLMRKHGWLIVEQNGSWTTVPDSRISVKNPGTPSPESDILAELRYRFRYRIVSSTRLLGDNWSAMNRAADEIERLRRDNDDLRYDNSRLADLAVQYGDIAKGAF